jgi:ATP-dependent helicase/nuclease subunit B
MTATPRVFNIPASAPFLPTLAQALLDGRLVPGFAPRKDPLALASATIYLPTRRSTRALGEALLEALGAEATLLPRIVPLGDTDEDALAFADLAGLPEHPAPISTAERRLVLARLVLQFAQVTGRDGRPLVRSSPAASIALADQLARLFDDLTIAGVSFDDLVQDGFVPAELDEYWQQSLEFLKIARNAWMDHLRERELVDPTEWRDRLLAREAKRIADDGGGPVIVAGSTGTIPAVARLIEAIAKRENGAVVLPGLDPYLDEISFQSIEGAENTDASPGHPQFGLKRLIERIGIKRADVRPLGAAAPSGREKLVSEAFRPAATTELWRQRGAEFADEAATALSGITLIEAAEPREEALSLAIALRECLETPDAHASLVTPDRTLARRVAAELRRWGIEVDDSAGTALADSEAGRLARLVAEAAAEELAPVPLLALLRHPGVRGSISASDVDRLEIAILRGPRPAAGAQGLMRALADVREEARKGDLYRRDPRMRLQEPDWEGASALAQRICEALEPLLALSEGKTQPFAKLIEAHRAALAALGIDLSLREPPDLRALGEAFRRFAAAAPNAAALSLADYADSFALLLSGEPPVRPPFDRAARIRILGPLEARLLDSERVLLGGLNEGTWPPETHAEAWLSRPMRRRLKLDLPERRIGLTAHDFAQAVSAREVIVSRARKQNGVETVASRFLQRLQAVAPEDAWQAVRDRGGRYLALARALERPSPQTPIKRPEPRPPVATRPARLSVTEIETLIRDPYSIYARHVLRLDPLDEIDADPGATERGTILHEAFSEFARKYPETLPANALDELLAQGEAAFASIKDFPSLLAIWKPRFERAARWLIGIEFERRREIEHILAETSGAIEFEAGERTFRLTARADRIEQKRDGTISIIDYKTGDLPSLKQVLIGIAPQLPLEAAIAMSGGFKDAPAAKGIADILVIKPSGGHPPGIISSLNPANATREAKAIADERGIANCDDLAEFARKQVIALLAAFADKDAAYHSIPRPKWRGRFGQYDHLARIKEWSANEEGGE